MKVYSRSFRGAYPSAPTLSEMQRIANASVINADLRARTPYVAQLRGFGNTETGATDSAVVGMAAGVTILSVAFAVALYGFAGYGLYKFATRK